MAQVERFIQQRRSSGKKPATVNRESGGLRQALNLAQKQGRLSRVPFVPMLKEDNARQGFFERGEFEAVVSRLPEPVADIAKFAYLSGWRKGEILPLRWDAVDRTAPEVRLRTSKNNRGRVLPLVGELWALIERRWKAREVEMPGGLTRLSDNVFHNGRNGKPIINFKKAWATACRKAGVPGKHFHDLRRTAVRDMIRAGTPQSIAMAISGHRTVSMFLRYDIANEQDKREALRKTEAHRSSMPTGSNVVSLRSD